MQIDRYQIILCKLLISKADIKHYYIFFILLFISYDKFKLIYILIKSINFLNKLNNKKIKLDIVEKEQTNIFKIFIKFSTYNITQHKSSMFLNFINKFIKFLKYCA